MTTTKERIFDALKDIEGLSVVYALDYQDDIELPYVRYQLLESNAIYLSNEEHNTRARYQLDLYSLQALDVQGEGILSTLRSKLRTEHLRATQWQEAPYTDSSAEETVYRYMIEVW